MNKNEFVLALKNLGIDITEEKLNKLDKYYDRFLIDVKNKDDFFTDRESAVLFGIPSNFIEGILSGIIK